MSPRRRVLLSALTPVIMLLAALAVPASAQIYDAARGSLGFSLDAIERSPRLLGMGQLTYVGDDPHTRITLWDFAANPLGILSDDSTSTIELYPGTSSYSGDHRADNGASDLWRQVLAGREGRVSGEVWRRDGNRAAYGLAGTFAQLSTDAIAGESIERRSTYGQPTVMPVLVGHVPFVKSDRWLYSARFYYSGESVVADYFQTVVNPQGEFIDQTGTPTDAPENFTATDYNVRSVGGGLGVGYDRGRALRVALTVDRVEHDIKGENNATRHSSETREKRPYRQEQLTIVGRLPAGLEWGVDGRDWHAASEQSWYFTASAGAGADPLSGRGKLLEREETGQALRTRLRWVRGPLELGGGMAASYRKITVTPPALDDLTSFNHFLNVVSLKQSADSLLLPDSVSAGESEERAWQAGGGLSLRLPCGRTLWGLEYHLGQAEIEQAVSGTGPLRKVWDVRTGLEYQITPMLMGRAGYRYRWTDEDDYTEQNEYIGNLMSLGLGLRPAGATWTAEAGYAIEWLQGDYGSALEPRACRQQLAGMLRWTF
jgi:opacity protein-like surface antigen